MKLNWTHYLKAMIALIAIILVLIGFLAGYLFADTEAVDDPFVYGIKSINEYNDADFFCSCMDSLGKTQSFTFSENGVKTDVDFTINTKIKL